LRDPLPDRERERETRTNADRARRRRTHLGRLLFELSTAFERESLARLKARGHHDLTPAQKQVIVHLPLAGARLTELAARAGVSKQAMMKLVDGLESIGYVRRADDPDDQRAKRVLLTRRGRTLIDDGLDIVADLEREHAAKIGRESLDLLQRELTRLAEALDIEMPDPDDAGS
jgi:DNA-binding MarR family transcriptional regulator